MMILLIDLFIFTTRVPSSPASLSVQGDSPSTVTTPTGVLPRLPPLPGQRRRWPAVEPKKAPHSTFPFLSPPPLLSSSSDLRLGAWMAGGVLGASDHGPLDPDLALPAPDLVRGRRSGAAALGR